MISIHALREEGDRVIGRFNANRRNFYPRPPRGGRRLWRSCLPSGARFLSTPSARRATLRRLKQRREKPISIHALREEGDQKLHRIHTRTNQFLSTPSARRATVYHLFADQRRSISIHALREEGDLDYIDTAPTIEVFLSTPSARRATSAFCVAFRFAPNFYPRPPRGGRLWLHKK